MNRTVLIVLLSLLFVSPVNAGIMSDASDAKIIVELKAMYQKMMDQLEELQAQNETLANVRDGINYSIESYHEVKNFDLGAITRRIQSDVEGQTGLHDINDLSLEQQISVIQDDINRRVGDPETTQAEREQLQQELDILDSIKRRSEVLTAINQNSTNNMSRASEDLGERDSARISAEGISTLVQIESLREMENNDDNRLAIKEAQVLRNLNQQQRKIIENAKRSGW